MEISAEPGWLVQAFQGATCHRHEMYKEFSQL